MANLRSSLKQSRRPYRQGFTLVELMIAVAIIGILTVIAYPTYTQHMVKSKRAEGSAALMDLSQRMERYFSQNNTYATATIASGNAATDVLSSANTENNHYQLAISNKTATTYTITATPQNQQATQDTKCGTLTLTHLGVKSVSGSGSVQDCW